MNVIIPLLVAFFLLPISMHAQHKRTKTSEQQYHENGEIKQTKFVLIVESKKPKLMEYYYKKKVVLTVYDTSGNKIYTKTTINKKGTYGKGCREILYAFEKYRPDGTKEWTYKSKCDCHLEVYKVYNERGYLLRKERKKIRRLY